MAAPRISSLGRLAKYGPLLVGASLLIGGVACWIVAQRPTWVLAEGPTPLISRLQTMNEVNSTRSDDPWGAFLRMWQALQQGHPEYLATHAATPAPKALIGTGWLSQATANGPSLGFPQLVSEHHSGATAALDYVVVYPQLAARTWAAVLPRSVVLKRSAGAWLLRNPGGLMTLLTPARP
jgi:hypothetical protein